MTSRNTIRTLALLAALAAAAALPGRAGAAANDPLFYATWHAPFGLPGATKSIDPGCGTGIDTLYLAFEPTQDETTFVGIAGDIYIYAQPKDSLRAFWSVGRDGVNHGGIKVEFGPGASFPGESPWTMAGPTSSAVYDRTRSSGRYRFGCVLPMMAGKPLEAHHRYTAARLLIRGMKPGLDGCASPVCIEWRRAEICLGTVRDLTVYGTGSRVVTRGPAAAACRDRIPGWRPPGPPGEVEVTTPQPHGGKRP